MRAHYGKLGEKHSTLCARVRLFHDIKVWGGRFDNFKLKECSINTFENRIIIGKLCVVKKMT
jgi:hypothetical protein